MNKKGTTAEVRRQRSSPSRKFSGRYVYAIIDAVDQEPLKLIGLDGAKIYTISDNRHSAVVSDLSNSRIRPERRHVAAHHQVLKQLMASGGVLPMAFGMIADSPEAVQGILGLNRSAFSTQLNRVRGKVEMGTRVTWDKPDIYEYFVTTRPELKSHRDRIFRGGREPSREEKIGLGRLFDSILTAAREEVTEKVMAQMQPYCVELAVGDSRNEREALNLFCLIDGACRKEFEQGIIEAAALFDEDLVFEFNGPWPPHHFVDIQLVH